MSGGYSGRFLQRQCEIQLSRDNLSSGEKVLQNALFRLSEPKIENFANHGATSGIYWVYYKCVFLSYSEVGMFAPSKI